MMGTSLAVQPFAGLAGRVGNDCPRLLINREKVGEVIQNGSIDPYKCSRLITDQSPHGDVGIRCWF